MRDASIGHHALREACFKKSSGGLPTAAGGLLGVGEPAEAVGGVVEAALQLHRGPQKPLKL